MGDAADDAFDQYIDGLADHDFDLVTKRKSYQKGSGNYCWKTADGTIINMNDMTNMHILNSIKICEDIGNTAKKQQLLEILEKRRSELPDDLPNVHRKRIFKD